MTLNNLAEQLPWLLRNPQATRPPAGSSAAASTSLRPSASAAGGSSSAAAALTPASTSASASASASASYSPTTAALISSFRKDPPLSGSGGSGGSSSWLATAVATPRASNAAGCLMTPVPTGTTAAVSSLRPTLLARPHAGNAVSSDAAEVATRDGTARPQPQPPLPRLIPPELSSTAVSAGSHIPGRRLLPQPVQRPAAAAASEAGCVATPTHQKASGSAKTPSRTPSAVPASHLKRSRTPAALSPSMLDFGSDIDLDDFDSVVDLTTDENTPSSSSPGAAPREDVRLWREDYASRPDLLPKRGKKRKSHELTGSPAKDRRRPGGKENAAIDGNGSEEDAMDVGDFPDINDLVSLSTSSPAAARKTPPKTPGEKSSRKLAQHSSPLPPPLPPQSVTPNKKKQKRESVRSDVVMDSEDEFVTPPTRHASFVTCPNDSVLDDAGPPSPPSPTFRAASHVADTPHRDPPPREAKPVPEDGGDIDMSEEHALQDEKSSTPQGSATAAPTPDARPPQPETAPATTVTAAAASADIDANDGDAEATQRPSILSYWPAVRWKQHGVDDKIRQNTADYMKALREKWPPARRLLIKGEKEPLLKEKQMLDGLVDELKAYASLYNDQEALLHAITEAYQNHQDTEAEEAGLDELGIQLQEREETLRARLADAAIDPAACPSDFDAGSALDVVVPATQHPDDYVPPMLSRNNTAVVESPSQVVLQTQMPPPRPQHHQQQHQAHGTGSWDEDCPRPTPPRPPRYTGPSHAVPDYFDDDDLFNGMDSLPPPVSTNGPSRRSPGRPPPAGAAAAAAHGHDFFSDFSDDVEMLQVAEHFEMQHSSSGAEGSARRPGPPSRSVLGPTSGNASGPPPREPTARSAAKKPGEASQRASVPPAELMRFEWSQEVRRALKDRFRMSGFRHNQLEAINATLAGKDAFVLMPTGGGKSLCYQLPAVISSGKTSGVSIVISPLLSLMQDQVDHLKALNIAASAFNSSTPAAARGHVLALFAKPNPEHFLQLLYVTPEMVSKSTQFCQGLATLYRNKKLARIVIDEAHCVSQWGHDFRPDYKALGTVRRQFPSVPVMALTATATPNVIVDIKHNLSIDGCKVFSQSFNRPNLYYEVREKGKNCVDSIADLINARYSGQTGIVYTLSQKSTVSIAQKLSAAGISAHHYHAGIPPEEKAQVQRDWQRGRIKVVVATIAFGMGIDKADVRFVVHHYLPKSLEGYYQETGRAGRDGKPSDCLLFFGYGDIKNLRKFITDSEASEEQKERQREMLSRMVDFCENKRDCRRSEILRYFGEDFDKTECGNTCDNCKSGSRFDLADFTEYAVAALRVVQEYSNGITMAQCTDILQGRRQPGKPGLEKVHGIAKQLKKHDINMIIYRLLGQHALREENKVNHRSDMAVQYFKLGHGARDFFSGKKRLEVVIKVGGDIATALTEGKAKPAKKKAAGSKSGDKAADKAPAKKGKGKAAAGASASASASASAAAKKKRKTVSAVLDEADVDDEEGADDGDSEFETFDGPMHANGYAKDNFVVSDNDEDADSHFGPPPPSKRSRAKARPGQFQQYAFQEPERADSASASSSRTPSRRKDTGLAPVLAAPPQRQRRLEGLGAPIARDPRLSEANVDPIHADIVAAFADEARRLEEKTRNEKGLRVLFTESHLREMAIGWTDSLDKMRRIPGIDVDHVQRFGARFLPLVKRYYATYQEMMGPDGGSHPSGDESPLLGPVSATRRPGRTAAGAAAAAAPSRSDLDAVVDLISSDDDGGDGSDGGLEEEDDDDDDSGGGGSHRAVGAGLSSTEAREAEQWRAQLETLQSQTGKSGGGGGSRKGWGGGGRGRRTFARRGDGSSRSGSGSYPRSRAASGGGGGGGGVTKRRTAAASGGSSRASGGSGIGMMPL